MEELKMKKLNKIIVAMGLAIGSASLVNVATNCNAEVVQAAKKSIHSKKEWGATKLFTTPKATRGTWYYRDYKNHLQKLKITTHTINGVNIYKNLSEKQFEKYSKRIQKMTIKKSDKLYDWFSKNIKSGKNVTRHGIKGMNINEWLVEAGSGAEFLPTFKTKHGKKVKALKIDTGAFIPEGYAYKDPKLTKRIDV